MTAATAAPSSAMPAGIVGEAVDQARVAPVVEQQVVEHGHGTADQRQDHADLGCREGCGYQATQP